jgi:hypothetical protein
MKAYKGFDPQLRCRDFQYEIGKKYQTDTAILCKAGFHACEHPLDTFFYYGPAKNRFCIVNLNEIQRNKNKPDKICGKKIEILKEINLTEIVKEAVNYTQKHINKRIKQTIIPKYPGTKTKSKQTQSSIAANTGDYSTAANTGRNSTATNTGNWSTATNTGESSAATNTGHNSTATNAGEHSTATNTGYGSAATNTGGSSAATNTGNWSAATNTGPGSTAANTGYYSDATNTGDYSAATNTGHYSTATNTGDHSATTNTGQESAATNTGNWSAATNTGYQATAKNTGECSAALTTGQDSTAIVETKNSIAIAIGHNNKAKGALGSYIMLTEWEREEGTGQWNITSAKACKVDGKTIKPDTFYILKNGEFRESPQQN